MFEWHTVLRRNISTLLHSGRSGTLLDLLPCPSNASCCVSLPSWRGAALLPRCISSIWPYVHSWHSLQPTDCRVKWCPLVFGVFALLVAWLLFCLSRSIFREIASAALGGFNLVFFVFFSFPHHSVNVFLFCFFSRNEIGLIFIFYFLFCVLLSDKSVPESKQYTAFFWLPRRLLVTGHSCNLCAQIRFIFCFFPPTMKNNAVYHMWNYVTTHYLKYNCTWL